MTSDIDTLIFQALFGDEETKKQKRKKIRDISLEKGIVSTSIHHLYQAFGTGKIFGFTVPAINIRALTYDTAAIIFELMLKHNIGAVVFEIARSEIEYTDQRPDEYTTSILAGAIKAGYTGPVFLQGDHYQFSKNKFSIDADAEVNRIKELTKESIEAGFYNIDIDASTLVDLEKSTLPEQQKTNSRITAEMTRFIRSIQPDTIQVSIGGEIGHIGGKNSTANDFIAFMDEYKKEIAENGISKVSVQTGTSHGGIPTTDGKIEDVKLDFSVLESVSEIARDRYGMGGAVQHGASTLPNELFGKFVEHKTLEIHLATGFQNIVYENMPILLREEIYVWLKDNLKAEWETDWTEEQFLYKTRKKAFGPFKKQLFTLSLQDKQPIADALSQQLEFLFEKLNTFNTRELTDQFI